MGSKRKFRDFDEWYEDIQIIHEEEIKKGNKMRVLDDKHRDIDTDRIFWHGIKIQNITKDKTGKWKYRAKLNIPYNKFPEFCDMLLKIKTKHFRTQA